jgi:hypothetical protein
LDLRPWAFNWNTCASRCISCGTKVTLAYLLYFLSPLSESLLIVCSIILYQGAAMTVAIHAYMAVVPALILQMGTHYFEN